MKQFLLSILTIGFAALFFSCATTDAGMTVTSSGIKNGVIEAKYGQFGAAANISEKNPATDDEGNKVIMKVNSLSFPLNIKNAPAGTKAYALYLHDPDAAVHGFGDFIHWLAYFTLPSLAEGASKNPPAGMVQGKNGWGDDGYAGMGPPDKLGYTKVTGGPTFAGTHEFHTYVLEVYALDSEVTLPQGFSPEQLQDAIRGKVLAQSVLNGKYHTR